MKSVDLSRDSKEQANDSRGGECIPLQVFSYSIVSVFCFSKIIKCKNVKYCIKLRYNIIH